MKMIAGDDSVEQKPKEVWEQRLKAKGWRSNKSLTRGRWSSGLPPPPRLQPSGCHSLARGQNPQMST